MKQGMTDSDGICGVCKFVDEDNPERLQIQCDGCNTWYHASCVNLEEYEIDDIDHYHCGKCVPKLGPSKEKRVLNSHRQDYSEVNAENKAAQNGTLQFISHLKRQRFMNPSHAMLFMENGTDLTSSFLETCCFDKPILVKTLEGLGMNVPSSMSLDDVEKLIDPDLEVDVIDVHRQHSYKMKISRFIYYFRQPKRTRIYNLISLEFSRTKLSDVVTLPAVVDELSWVNQFWPKKFENTIAGGSKELSIVNEHALIKPEVSKFCLISMRDSFTDFHIDFGGTSVWYHVLWGEKWFYLVEPTESNLALYEDWSHAKTKSERFFGDEVDRCYFFALKPGQTLFIPTGWIHAVLTPTDTLVFGGNFLHSFNIGLQIRIYEMELAAATHEKFMFPHFELLNWYAGLHFLEMLKDANEEKVSLKHYLMRGIRCLVTAMKRWITRNQSATWPLAKISNVAKRNDKIDSLTCAQLLKKLEKAFAVNEKQLSQSKIRLKIKTQTKRLAEVGANVKPAKLPRLMTPLPSNQPVGSPPKSSTLKPVVQGSFRNAKTVHNTDSDLTGCPKSPVKLSLKPGVWNVPMLSPKNLYKESVPPLPVSITPICTLKVKLSRPEGESVTAIKAISDLDAKEANGVGNVLKLAEAAANISTFPNTDSRSELSVSMDAEQTSSSAVTECVVEEVKNEVSNTTPVQPVRRRVGFSLLDLNKMPSPPPFTSSSSPLSPRLGKIEKIDAKDVNSSSTTGSVVDSVFEKVQQNQTKVEKHIDSSKSQKLKLKISKKPKTVRPKKALKILSSETGTHLTGMFGISKHGRVQKMNQKVFGETGKSTEFVPELGQCRKDEEFVYPSLFDSDGEESRLKRRSKSDDSSTPFSPPGKIFISGLHSGAAKKKRPKGVQKPEPHQSTITSPTSLSDDSQIAVVNAQDMLVSSNNPPSVSSQKKPTVPSIKPSVLKPKKKVTTAKQRLATKLKLHRMIPSL